MNELIVPLGRDINPRFSSTSSSGKTARIVKSSSFHIEKPVSDNKTESKSSTLVKSSTFESLFEVSQGAPDLESEIKKATQASTNQTESASLSTAADPFEDSPTTTNTMEVGLETVHHHHKFGWTEDSAYAVNPGHRRHDIDMMFSSKPYSSTKLQGKRQHGTTVEDSSHGLPHRIGESGTGVHVATAFHEDSTGTDTARLDEEDDIQVIDFEVTSSETETTVFLKHLLATSSLNKDTEESTDSSTSNHGRRSTGSSSALWTMPAIEESDSEESESYYESEDIVTIPPLRLPIVPYTLPIPTVNLQDEDGTILEVILKGREGVTESAVDDNEADDGTGAATVDSGSDSLLVANYSPQTVYDDFGGPSTKL